jgi:Autotransporter beta-domain
LIDASVTRIDLDGLHEWGGGAADLIVRGSGQTVLTVTPALEMGTAWWLGNGMVVRAFMRGGASWYGGNDLALAASFAAAPDSVGSFTMVTRMDDVMGVLGAGLDIITSSDSALRFASVRRDNTDPQHRHQRQSQILMRCRMTCEKI